MSDNQSQINPIDDFVEWYGSKQDRSKRTGERYAVRLRQWREWLQDRGKSIDDVAEDVDARRASGVTTDDVQRFLSDLRDDGYAESTCSVARSAISQYYQYLRTENPAENAADSWTAETRKKQELRSKYGFEQLKTEDVEALIENVPKPHFRNKLIVRLLAQTGVRRGELAQIRVEDLDIEERVVQIDTEKDDGYRTLPFDKSLRTPLRIWKDTKRQHVFGVTEDTPWLFPSRGGGHISGYQVNEIVKTAAENAGLQDDYGEDAQGRQQNLITAHSLRHYYALQCAKNGMAAPFLRKLMGHTDLDITQVYLEAAEDTTVEMGKDYGPSV